MAELIGALGVIAAAVVTGMFQRLRRENNDAHHTNGNTLTKIAETVEHIDEQLDEIVEWQVEHEKLHEDASQDYFSE